MTGNGKTNIPENEQVRPSASDVAAEFAEVGRKLRDALTMAWNSQERHQLEGEIRDGLSRLAKEVDAGIDNLKKSEVGQKVQTSAKQVSEDVQAGKVADEARKGLVTALKSLSEALDKMASSFTPAEDEAPKK